MVAKPTHNSRSFAGAATGQWYERGPAAFAIATLRSVGQVDLQARLLTGVLITVALFSAGWEPGVFGLLGAAVSTATAAAFGADPRRISLGLEGYNGALIGIVAVVYLGAHPSTWGVAIAGAIACTVVAATLSRLLGTWSLPALTGPFCVVATGIVIGAPGFERIWHGGTAGALPAPVDGSTTITLGQLVESVFTNVSQIFLVDKWWAGAIMLLGLAIASRRVLAAAVAGSVVGTLTAWALGAPAAEIAAGIYGFNAVLVMIALAATFLGPGRAREAYAVVAAVCATFGAASLANLFAPVGGHTLTWPFNLTTWAFLAAAPAFASITKSRPEEEGSG